ncbi:DUF523 domain-containing protein [Clostridium aestuarii]|uniref:DUF523 domain-containing protein n=1 Tax=Clostridium aestuarii TaxID=338193 RepID=A0ABT4D0D5_9CLOT|nr:DUF523 domain-containing protein [Clostridium aestuarii]MCY6484706.1 DUF523 domain-containing protein [Clostridium aestuarii]
MYLVSACLAGVNCRYNGGNITNIVIQELVKQGKAIAICPEQLSGLPTPRACCEIVIAENGNRKIATKDGQDFTKEFVEGAEKTLAIAKVIDVKKAILQSRSPSCGCGTIYNGTFTGNLKKGYGFTAELLIKNGIEVYTENDLDKLKL